MTATLAAPTIPGLKTPLWRHQAAAVAFARDRAHTLLDMRMGHGKSLVSLALLEAWDAKSVLILAPKSVVSVWPGQFARHVETPWTVCPLVAGTVAQRAALASAALASSPRVAIVVNYDAAIQPAMTRLLLHTTWDVVVADEVHRAKAPRGVISRTLHKIGQRAGVRLGLSGTPMPHSPLDVFGQARFLDDRVFGLSWLAFRHRYLVPHPLFPNQLPRPNARPNELPRWKDLDELMAKVATFTYRSPAAAVELPEATHTTRTVALSPAARRLYRDMERDFTATLDAYGRGDETVTASVVLTKILRLQQITSGHVTTDDGQIRTVDTAKRDALVDTLADLGADEPVVVFGRFRHDLAVVHAAAQTLGRRVYELSGRRREVDAWQADQSGGAVLAAQTQAGSEGIDLTKARLCVYLSKTFELGRHAQSLARCHRPGQTRPVLYVHITASGTIDDQIEAALASRRDLIASLVERVTRCD